MSKVTTHWLPGPVTPRRLWRSKAQATTPRPAAEAFVRAGVTVLEEIPTQVTAAACRALRTGAKTDQIDPGWRSPASPPEKTTCRHRVERPTPPSIAWVVNYYHELVKDPNSGCQPPTQRPDENPLRLPQHRQVTDQCLRPRRHRQAAARRQKCPRAHSTGLGTSAQITAGLKAPQRA